MIIDDLFYSNANGFMDLLKSKLQNLELAAKSATPGGDFHDTIRAQIGIVRAALNAANAEYNALIAPFDTDEFVFTTGRQKVEKLVLTNDQRIDNEKPIYPTCGSDCGQC